MRGADEFRAAVEAGDVKQLQRIAAVQEPHLPQMTDAQAERVMHDARTRAKSIPFRLRAWSHRWLVERGFDSGLPDHLRPKAEQVHPTPAYAVGIALGSSNPLLRAAMVEIRPKMEAAVLEAEADGKLLDADYVRARLLETKHQSMMALFGRLSIGENHG